MKTATGLTVIEHGQLVDGTGAPAVPNAALVIEEGKGIASAQPIAFTPQSKP